jgi:hypothetical protein
MDSRKDEAMSVRTRLFYIAPLAILGILLFIVLGGLIVMRLWNWLLPPLFGWHVITFWQALGILVLCRILFGGLGPHGGAHSRIRRRIGERMAERWEAMTPEERERLRRGMGEHFGCGGSTGEGKAQ